MLNEETEVKRGEIACPLIQLVIGKSKFKPKPAPKPWFDHQALLPLQILNGLECHIKGHQLPSFFKDPFLFFRYSNKRQPVQKWAKILEQEIHVKEYASGQ